MSNIFDNTYRKINLNDIEIDLNDYFISSISMEHDTERIYMGWMDTIGRDIIVNHRLTIKNDYFEFEILYLDNRDKKEILYLFDIFKQLSDLEEDYRNYEWQQSLIKKKYLGTLYTHDSEYIMLSDKKVKVLSDIGIILKHLEDEFDTDIDFEFSAIDYTFSKIEIGFQKRS